MAYGHNRDDFHRARTQDVGDGHERSAGSGGLSFGGLQNGLGPNALLNVDNPYEQFFGALPMAQFKARNARGHYIREEAYDGMPSLKLSIYVLRRITEEDMFWCTKILPWADATGFNVVAWDTFRFHEVLLDRRPAESVSRTLTSDKIGDQVAFTTMGRAMEMEYGFYNTPQGRRHFNAEIEVIKNAVQETAAFGAAHAIYNAKPPRTAEGAQETPHWSLQEYRRIVMDEVALWHCFAKEQDGYRLAVSRAKQALAHWGVTPDTLILPAGAGDYLSLRQRDSAAATGKAQPEFVTEDLNYPGMQVFQSRAFSVGDRRPKEDPAFQWRTIGGYFLALHDHVRQVPPHMYNTSMRTVHQFSEKLDAEHPHDIRDILRYSGLVDADFELTEHGKEFFEKDWRHEQKGQPRDPGFRLPQGAPHGRAGYTDEDPVPAAAAYAEASEMAYAAYHAGRAHQSPVTWKQYLDRYGMYESQVASMLKWKGSSEAGDPSAPPTHPRRPAAAATRADGWEPMASDWPGADGGAAAASTGWSGAAAVPLSAEQKTNGTDSGNSAPTSLSKALEMLMRVVQTTSTDDAARNIPWDKVAQGLARAVDFLNSNPTFAMRPLVEGQSRFILENRTWYFWKEVSPRIAQAIELNNPTKVKENALAYLQRFKLIDSVLNAPVSADDIRRALTLAACLAIAQDDVPRPVLMFYNDVLPHVAEFIVKQAQGASRQKKGTAHGWDLDEVEGMLRREIRAYPRFLRDCLEHDCFLPVSFICWTPHERFYTGAMVVGRVGSELGQTFVGAADMQMGADSNRKMIFGHFTMMQKAVVIRPELITNVPNVIVSNYGGGADHDFFDLLNDEHRRRYANGEVQGMDIFVTAVPPDWRPKDIMMDITGRFNPAYVEEPAGAPLHYPTAEWYRSKWGWQHGATVPHVKHESEELPRTNTLCLARYQRIYEWHGSVQSSGHHRIIMSKGHNGENVYEGSAKTRLGRAMRLKPVNYARTATMSLVP